MAHILLSPVGSHGDVHPLVGLGVGLQRRGHAITLLAADTFAPLADRHGFAFAPVGTDEEYQKQIRHPDLWHPSKSFRVVLDPELVRKYVPVTFGHIRDRYERGNTVVVAGSLAMAARIANEKLGVPLVSVHLQPMGFRSIASPPAFPSFRLPDWLPRSLVRFAYWYGDVTMIDPILAGPLNEFRSTLALPPVRRVFHDWRHSPTCVLGLFPDWFASAPDWPSQTKLTGFVGYDQGEPAMPKGLDEWLSEGPPPVVFTFGTAMRQGLPFFTAAAEAATHGGFRALILAKGKEQVPFPLPAGVRHFDYAPFSQVFPRVAAVCHHGGIGTTAATLTAGVPHLVMPLAFDQPDNAYRLEKLGVGRTLPPKRFTADRVRTEIAALTDPKYTTRAKEVAAKVKSGPDGVEAAVAEIERQVGTDR